jgi:FkbM family methyltransferase
MPGWFAEIVRENANLNCGEFLLQANGADPNQKFHEPDNLAEYNRCMWELRGPLPKTLAVAGVHYPTTLLTNFRDPPVHIPKEVEAEMGRDRAARSDAAPDAPDRSQMTRHLHQALGLRTVDPEVDGPAPHAYVLPYYDTNIGHWMKQFGSMNVLQSYEMQSLLRKGDTVVDAGANLGSYTIGFAEKIGLSGAVLAFEPFRWLHQILTANVALNGLQNVWVFPAGLGDTTTRIEAHPPQLRFFSSPGGVRLTNQTGGLDEQTVFQLYDMDMPLETVAVMRLDDIVFGGSNLGVWPVPRINDVRLIKIDVEGMEKEVVLGASQVIQSYKPIIWTENVGYFESGNTDFLAIMEHFNYGCARAQNAPNDIVCTDKTGQGHQI